MLNCKQVTHLLSEMRERELRWRERLPLKLHLLMCAGCNNFRKQLDFLHRACREYAQGRSDSNASPP